MEDRESPEYLEWALRRGLLRSLPPYVCGVGIRKRANGEFAIVFLREGSDHHLMWMEDVAVEVIAVVNESTAIATELAIGDISKEEMVVWIDVPQSSEYREHN